MSRRDPGPVMVAPSTRQGWPEPAFPPASLARLVSIGVNIVGATGAGYFAIANLHAYQQTHRLIGVGFVAVQMWVVAAYLVRRRARVVTRRPSDWLLACGGTFGGVLMRPVGAHPHWGLDAGLGLQLLGLTCCVLSFLALGRSFGFAAADRGLVHRGPYAVVRHPIYASYLFVQVGYLLQSISVSNALVVLMVSGCNVGRALAEERILATSGQYGGYVSRVRWRLIPGVW